MVRKLPESPIAIAKSGYYQQQIAVGELNESPIAMAMSGQWDNRCSERALNMSPVAAAPKLYHVLTIAAESSGEDYRESRL